MSTNKNATIRYHALDQCFSNPGKRYFMEDLIKACNEALYEFSGVTDGIKKRQVYNDIQFMESDQGWSIPLERRKDGRKVFYRYSNRKYSIKNQSLNQLEVEQLKETLSILTRFKGMPQFEWMEELLIRIESVFNWKRSKRVIVDFEQNPYLKGLNHFTEIFAAIQYRKVLEIRYKGFKQLEVIKIILHPYFLKQYNSRWFLFGYNENQKSISNLALDRVEELKEISGIYIENKEIDFEQYFDDVIGVTVKEKEEPTIVRLNIEQSLWPYIESKPIHGSQKIKSRMDDGVVIELELQINYELISLLFSLGENVKVISPQTLRTILKTKADAVLKNYL